MRKETPADSPSPAPLRAEPDVHDPHARHGLQTRAQGHADRGGGGAGIGITPARSIILQSVHDESGHRIFLFYSNKRPEDAAFLEELVRVADAQENVTIVATMTEPEKSRHAWTGETGYIDQAMLARHIEDLTTPIYYLCGPAGMVTAMRTLLNNAGVDDDDIRTEEFTGY